MLKKMIIAGGTGFIGRMLAKKARSLGYYVSLLTRNPSNNSPEDYFAEEIIYWNPNLQNSLAGKLNDAIAVVNLAGASIAGGRWTKKYKSQILSSRLSSTVSIVNEIKNLENPPFLFSASAVGFYGNTGDISLDENATVGNGFLADVCRQWENAAMEVRSSTRVVVGRIGIVLSADGGSLPKMTLPFRFFIGGRVGSGKQWVSWIHINDLIEIILQSIQNETYNGIINCVAPDPVSMDEFFKLIGKTMRRPYWTLVPAWALKLVMGEAASIILEGQRVYPRLLLEKSFTFEHPNPEEALISIFSKN